MPYGERVFNPAGDRAEGDKFFGQFIYNDTSLSLTYGMPVWVDIRDAAEFNAKNSNTAISPAIVRTGGKVVLGTTSAGVGTFGLPVGIFQPENPGETPAKGDPIRVLTWGYGIVSAISPTGNSAAILVGTKLIASSSSTSALPESNAAALAAPSSLTATPYGTTGAATVSYTIYARNAAGVDSPVSNTGTSTTSNATLSVANGTVLAATIPAGTVQVVVVRTAGGPSQGVIAIVPVAATATTFAFYDFGYASQVAYAAPSPAVTVPVGGGFLIGEVLATGTAVANGNSIAAAGSNAATLVNAFVRMG